MATKLRKMKLTSVDLVRAGANQEADICLFKSADPPEATESPTEAETNIFKRFLNWIRENPTEAATEPRSHIEKADEEPDLEYIYKSALAESLQSIMADDTLTEIEKKDMTEQSLRQYADKIQELDRHEEDDDYDDDDEDYDDDDTIEEEIIEEVVERKSDDGFYDYIEETQIRKYNHNHGADGKFSSSPGAGGGSSSSSGGGSKAGIKEFGNPASSSAYATTMSKKEKDLAQKIIQSEDLDLEMHEWTDAMGNRGTGFRGSQEDFDIFTEVWHMVAPSMKKSANH